MAIGVPPLATISVVALASLAPILAGCHRVRQVPHVCRTDSYALSVFEGHGDDCAAYVVSVTESICKTASEEEPCYSILESVVSAHFDSVTEEQMPEHCQPQMQQQSQRREAMGRVFIQAQVQVSGGSSAAACSAVWEEPVALCSRNK